MKNEDIETLLALLSECETPKFAQTVLCTLNARFPGLIPAFWATQSASNGAENPFKRGIRAASEFRDEVPPIVKYWFGLYPGSLIYFCGETGAGKSSLLYNILIHAARNEPLWQVPFGTTKPLKILYIDPENSGDFDSEDPGLCNQKIKRIGQGKPEGLHFHDGQGVNLSKPEQLAALESLIVEGGYHIVVLDPIINLFGTKDENDNAEAGKQFTELKAFAKRTRCCVIAVHHTGRDNSSNFGRGASARLGACDVGLMLRVKGEADETNDEYRESGVNPRCGIVRLQMVKNRMEPGKASLYMRMIGDDKFERISYDDWKAVTKKEPDNSQNNLPSKIEEAKSAILDFLSDGSRRRTEEVIAHLKTHEIGENTTREALRELTQTHLKIEKVGHTTFYKLDDDASPSKESDHHHQVLDLTEETGHKPPTLPGAFDH